MRSPGEYSDAPLDCPRFPCGPACDHRGCTPKHLCPCCYCRMGFASRVPATYLRHHLFYSALSRMSSFRPRVRSQLQSLSSSWQVSITVRHDNGPSWLTFQANGEMCYSITTNQAAIIALFRAVNRQRRQTFRRCRVLFPDYPAPVIRNTDHGTRVGHDALGNVTGRRSSAGCRSRTSAIRRRRTGAAGSSRRTGALSPANSFAEYAPEANPEPKRRMSFGSRSTRTALCSPSRVSGPNSKATVAPSRNQFLVRTSSTGF